MFGLFGRGRLRLKPDCWFACDRGLVRRDNQDRLFADPEGRFFCVADGMGGGQGGALASQMICDALAETVSVEPFEDRIEAVDRVLSRTHAEIAELARTHGFEQMGTTLAALLIDEGSPARAAVVHVGDSRVYRRRNLRLKRLTEDHRTSAHSHLLTRAVGMGPEPGAEWLEASFRKGDFWLLCSDGVHEMLPDSTINALMAYGTNVETVAHRMEKAVREAGARDNYSFILLRA